MADRAAQVEEAMTWGGLVHRLRDEDGNEYDDRQEGPGQTLCGISVPTMKEHGIYWRFRSWHAVTCPTCLEHRP